VLHLRVFDTKCPRYSTVNMNTLFMSCRLKHQDVLEIHSRTGLTILKLRVQTDVRATASAWCLRATTGAGKRAANFSSVLQMGHCGRL